jgi:molybdenum cofactor cytidylyltransferase
MNRDSVPVFAVIILAAGASSRMGRPKLLLPWKDTTVIGRLISQWRAVGAAQIAVVHRPNDGALAAELNCLGLSPFDCIENPQPERGMFSSIACAANWPGWKKEVSAWVIVLGDQPHLRLGTLQKLLEFHRLHPDAFCQPAFHGEPKHPVILPPSAFHHLKTSKAATLKDFLKQIPCRSVQCEMDDAGLSLDIDTPEDYKRALNQPDA